MRHLVGFSLSVGLFGLFGCSLSTVGSMDPTQGGKCDKPMQTATAPDMCTQCTCTDAGTWDCNSDACNASGGTGVGTGGTKGSGGSSMGGTGMGASPGTGKGGTGGDGMSVGGTGMGGSSGLCMRGETKLADDGCNKCTCTDSGDWACTLLGCTACTPMDTKTFGCQTCICDATGEWNCMTVGSEDCMPAACKPGETTLSGDGCNTCTCTEDGQLACTDKSCGEACPPPVRYDPKTCMSTGAAYAQDPTTGQCCAYSSQCETPVGWKTYDTPGCATPGMCPEGTADCDGAASNGCETKLATDPSNCGACGVECMAPAGMMATCNNGVCSYPGQNSGTCFYEGLNHDVGDSFASRDGCNTCGCVVNPDGTTDIACTERACMCSPEKEPYHQYAGTSPDACKTIDFACPSDTTMFSNACGCGCEQSDECPNSFDCTGPGTMMGTCDPALMAKCPYSEITAETGG
jgi:hypothetical protein